MWCVVGVMCYSLSVVHSGEDVFLRWQFLLFPPTIISVSSKSCTLSMVSIFLVVQDPRQRPRMDPLGHALDYALLFSLCFNLLRSLQSECCFHLSKESESSTWKVVLDVFDLILNRKLYIYEGVSLLLTFSENLLLLSVFCSSYMLRMGGSSLKHGHESPRGRFSITVAIDVQWKVFPAETISSSLGSLICEGVFGLSGCQK